MTKARTLAGVVSEGSPLADGTISAADVNGLSTTLSSYIPLTGGTMTGELAVPSLKISVSDDTIMSAADIGSWTHTKSISVAADETEPRDVFFSSTGDRMYVLGNAGNDVIQYNLSTPWDIATATVFGTFVVSSQDGTPYGMYIRPDGLRLYVVGENDAIYRYDLTTAWNITTAAFVNSFSVTAQETSVQAISFSSDGTRMYVIGTSGDDVNQYILGTAWDITTAVYDNIFSVSAYETNPQALDFSADGTKMYVLGTTFNRIVEYTLSSPWNVTTAVYSGFCNVGTLDVYQVTGSSGLYVNLSAGVAYVSDYTTDRIFQLSTNIPATKLTGSKWIVGPDLHLENDLIVNRNSQINNNLRVVNALSSGSLSTGSFSSNSTVSFTGTTTNISIGTSQSTGVTDIGGTSQTGAISIHRSTGTQTLNLATGATASGSTKTVNLATGGVSGSTTNVTIGSANGTTATANGNWTFANTITGSVSGNAGTATALQTARNINGVSFDGSANITVADSTKLPLAGGTMTGAISFAAGQTWPTFNQNTTGSAATLATGRTIGMTGDVTWTSAAFNGSANVTGTATLAASGVTAGTYTKVTVDAKGRATSGTTLSASDIPNLDASKITSGVLDAARLPSYVDDVLEYANLAGFPASGETGKIYVALDTNKTYRWSGSSYVYITSGAVDSVAGKTGVVTLTNSDVGLGNVENKSSATIRGELTSSNVTTALGFTPLSLAGGTMTGAITFAAGQTWPTFNQNTTGSAATLTTGRTIGMTGDVTWTSAAFNGSANVTGTATLANSGVTAGTYTKVTVDAKGRVTTGASLASADLPTYTGTITSSQVTTALGFTPYNSTNPSGYITSSASITGSSYRISFLDTRGTDDQPQGKTGYALSADFKNNTAVGSPPVTASGTYSHIITVAGWDTSGGSGGWPSQLSIGDGIAVRQATSATTWGAWKNVLHSSNYTSYRGTQIVSPNGATVVSGDSASAMPDSGQSFIHTLGYGPSSNDGHILGMSWANTTTSYGAQIWLDTDPTNRMAVRSRNSSGTWNGWSEVLTSGNYSSYALPLSGGTLTGELTLSGNNTWFGGSTYLRSNTAFSFLTNSGSAQNARFNGIQVSDSYAGSVPTNGILFGTDTTLVRDGAYQLSLSGNRVLHAGNYTSYSPSLTGSGASGTWGINVTGSAGSAPLLSALGSYVWSASTLPTGYNQGIQCSFVYSGWQSYGSVMTMSTYSGGGGALQMYVPYSPTYGGTGLQVRFGNYDVSNGNSWTAWKTLLASDNYTSYSPSLTGSGASGTWGISVTGSAATFTSTSQNSRFNSIGVGTAASGTAGEIRATNNITAYYSSDIKFKENVHEISNAASIVCAIGGKYFDWNDQYIADHGGADGYFIQKQDFGVIAQDVLQVFPRAVRKRADGSLAVDYEKLSALAFAAIREQDSRIARLESIISKLIGD